MKRNKNNKGEVKGNKDNKEGNENKNMRRTK